MAERGVEGQVYSINVSEGKGGAKIPVPSALLIREKGFKGDGHAGPGRKQISLLSWESAGIMRRKGACISPGSFGENITTRRFDLDSVRVGDRLRVGDEGILEVTERGKKCPSPCRIFHQVGYCIMPDEGVFCRVIRGGMVLKGDRIRVIAQSDRGRKRNG